MDTAGRRAFLARVGAAAVVGGAVATRVEAGEPLAAKKEVVPGSPYPTFSRAIKCGGLVYVSGVLGQIPGTRDLASADFAGQCRQAMENLKASVEAAGSSMDKVLKCGAFLTEQSDFAAFNKIYVTYFPTDPPARSTVIVKALVAPGAKLEIDCVACV
ncbi:MAG TPA: RidA family protein [Phycisphaerae bacterium]|nr:RidA family protein [Phycisphaerae bacterium]